MTTLKVAEVRKNIADLTPAKSITTKKAESHPYFFLSLDLVNSTELKSTDEKWPTLIEAFYGAADSEVKKIQNIQSWKSVGDEVLFYKKLRSVADLEQCVEMAYDAVKTVAAEMKNIQEPDATTKLSVKGTAWIAKAVRLPPAENRYDIGSEHRNLVISIPADRGQTFQDFLGPDIDIGFRVSKFAHSKLLTVSAELARVILKKGTQQTAEKLRIVGYEKLKGVWGGRYYPILWFSKDWQNVNDIFEYDAIFDSPHVAKAQNDFAVPLTSTALDRAFETIRCHELTEEFISILAESESQPADAVVELDAVNDASLEVHCVAVCFRENGQVLIGKRPENKRILPNKWEFGCAQLSINKSFFETMQIHYKADFGVELEFRHKDPIAQYFIPDKGVSGVVFVADVMNPDEAKTKFLKEKHSEICWIDPENHGLSHDDCIPEFSETLEKACTYWKT